MTARDLLENPDAVLTTTHLSQLGYSRRAQEAIFRAATEMSGVEKWPGFDRKMIRVGDFLELRERYAYRDDRVIPA